MTKSEIIIKLWPDVRKALIWMGAANSVFAAIWWLMDLNPTFHSFWVFIGLVAFLLGAKAQDDPS